MICLVPEFCGIWITFSIHTWPVFSPWQFSALSFAYFADCAPKPLASMILPLPSCCGV